MTNTEQLLERIAIALEANLPGKKTGLIDIVTTTYLYVGRGEEEASNSCWYTRFGGANVPQSANGLAGKLVKIETAQTEYKGKKSEKLHIWMDCGGQAYCVQSGLDTLFSRGVLLALPEATIGQDITIGVKPSKEDEKIVFGSIATASGWVRSEWDKETSEQVLFDQALKALYSPASTTEAKERISV
jgi:hypothetical protein